MAVRTLRKCGASLGFACNAGGTNAAYRATTISYSASFTRPLLTTPLMNRRPGLSLALALPVLLVAATPAQAQQNPCGVQNGNVLVPTVTVCVLGTQYVIPNILVDGKFAILQKTTIDLGAGASFTVGANFNSDPFSNFAFGSTIPGGFGVITFDAYFSTPVVGGPYNFAHSYYTSDLTLTAPIGAGPSAGFYSGGNFPTYLSGFTNLGSLGVDVGTGACNLSVPSSVACPPGDKTNMVSPISPNSLTARLSYSHGTSGTGTSSTVNFQGGVELTSVTTTVPEPTTVVMMSIGLLLLGGVAGRRRKDA